MSSIAELVRAGDVVWNNDSVQAEVAANRSELGTLRSCYLLLTTYYLPVEASWISRDLLPLTSYLLLLTTYLVRPLGFSRDLLLLTTYYLLLTNY